MNHNPSSKFLCKDRAGQNVIEYLLVTAAFVLVCVIFFRPDSGPARTAMENILNIEVQGINAMRGQIQF